jgi:hypothetical protein
MFIWRREILIIKHVKWMEVSENAVPKNIRGNITPFFLNTHDYSTWEEKIGIDMLLLDHLDFGHLFYADFIAKNFLHPSITHF